MGANSHVNVALPQDKDGRTYVTDQMMAEDAALADFLRRTKNSWYRDELQFRWVLYPTVGKS